MAREGYIKFTGDYSKLNSMGFTFQKLYAANYMQWEKGGLRIWKKGHDITHDEYNLYKLITFLRTKPAVRAIPEGYGNSVFSFFKFYKDNTNQDYDYLPYTEENRKRLGDNMHAWLKVTDDTPRSELPPCHTSTIVTEKLVRMLEELEALGWYEVVECDDNVMTM